MTFQNIIHVKIEHSEAINSKRDFLTTQASILKIAKATNKYKLLRIEELKLKEKLHRKMSEVKTDLTKLSATLPKVKVPEIIRTPEPKTQIEKRIKTVHAKHDTELESQLSEIQEQLRKLQAA